MVIYWGCIIALALISLLMEKKFGDFKYYGHISERNEYNKNLILKRIIVTVSAVIFIMGTYFTYKSLMSDVYSTTAEWRISLKENLHVLLTMSLILMELILLFFLFTNPQFQQHENYEIREKIEDGKKITNIRYKDYEYEFIGNNINYNNEKNNKRVSILNRHKIRRYYRYALLNILNKPMDLKKIEQYESARNATNDEIIEYYEILRKRKEKNVINLRGLNLIRLFFVIGAIGAITGGLNLVINPHDTRSAVKLLVESVFCCGLGVILYIHYNNQYLKIKKKQQKQDELLLSILKESKIYIVEGRELLYKFEGSDYEGRIYPSKRKYNQKKYAIFVDERNNYINKWFGIGGKSFGSIGPREIPWNIIGTKKIYIIKHNDTIIVDGDFKETV